MRTLIPSLLLSLTLCAGAPVRAEEHEAPGGHGSMNEHAAAAAHPVDPEHANAAHGGGHGPLIDNWWSWDFGPNKPVKNPPFGFALINFAVFLFIIGRLAGKPFREFLSSRHHEVKKALDEAAKIQAKAKEELARYQAQMKKMDEEVATLLARVRQEAEAERTRIIKSAEAQAEQLRRDAENQMQAELTRAQAELRSAVVEEAVAAARSILQSQVAESDHRRLVDDFVGRLEHTAQGDKHKTKREA